MICWKLSFNYQMDMIKQKILSPCLSVHVSPAHPGEHSHVNPSVKVFIKSSGLNVLLQDPPFLQG